MRSRRASSAMADCGSRRLARTALAAALAALVLLPGCAVLGVTNVAVLGIQGVGVAAEAAYAAANATSRESTLQDALASRTFAYPPIVVGPALQQAAQIDGRRIEGSFRLNEALVVSYAASASTGGDAGSVAVKSYGRGYVTFSTTVIVLRGPTGSEEVGRKVGEQLLDAMAADLADMERQVATKAVAVDVAAVFDALAQVGRSQGREVLTRDPQSHALRVSFPFFMEGRNAEGFPDIACDAKGGNTIVTLIGDGKSPAVDVRKAANSLLAAMTELLRQPA